MTTVTGPMFRDATPAPSRPDSLAGTARSGIPIVAVFPGRYPRALIEAAGARAVEIWDPPVPPSHSVEHVQPFTCSVARRGFDLARTTRTNVRAFLFPHTCDTLQNLFTILRDLVADTRHCFLFCAPRSHLSPEARARYLVHAIRELAPGIEKAVGRDITASALDAAVRARRLAEEAKRNLYRRRAEGSIDCSNAEFYRVVRQDEFMPPEEFVRCAAQFLASSHPPQKPWKLHAVLSGILPDSGLLEILDRERILVVEDDLLSCGRRFPRAEVQPSQDPWTAMSDALLSLPPCSSWSAPLPDRVAFIRAIASASRARAVLFHAVKFCETEAFDHPYLTSRLRESGLPTLVLESEIRDAAVSSLSTRVQAFVESLQ